MWIKLTYIKTKIRISVNKVEKLKSQNQPQSQSAKRHACVPRID